MKTKQQEPIIRGWYTWVRLTREGSPYPRDDAFQFERMREDMLLRTLVGLAKDHDWMGAAHVIAIWDRVLDSEEIVTSKFPKPKFYIHTDGRIEGVR